MSRVARNSVELLAEANDLVDVIAKQGADELRRVAEGYNKMIESASPEVRDLIKLLCAKRLELRALN